MLVKIQQKYSGLGFLPHLECGMLCHLQGTGSHRIQTKHLSLPLFPPRVEPSVTGTVMHKCPWYLNPTGSCCAFSFFWKPGFHRCALIWAPDRFSESEPQKSVAMHLNSLTMWEFLIYVVVMSMPLELGMVTSQWFLSSELYPCICTKATRLLVCSQPVTQGRHRGRPIPERYRLLWWLWREVLLKCPWSAHILGSFFLPFIPLFFTWGQSDIMVWWLSQPFPPPCLFFVIRPSIF